VEQAVVLSFGEFDTTTINITHATSVSSVLKYTSNTARLAYSI